MDEAWRFHKCVWYTSAKAGIAPAYDNGAPTDRGVTKTVYEALFTP